MRYLPFMRNVRKITKDEETSSYTDAKGNPVGFRWSSLAIKALQELVENRIVNACAFGNAAAIHGKRVTLMPKDLQLKKKLCATNQG